jgi:hypothetical protein
LFFVDWRDHLQRLDFHDHLAFHHQVGVKPGVNVDCVNVLSTLAPIDHRDSLLA